MANQNVHVDDGRHYTNLCAQKEPSYMAGKFEDVSSFKHKVESSIRDLLLKFEARVEHETDRHDGSVYTGTTGIAVLYLHLATIKRDESFLHKAADWLKKNPLRHSKSGRREVLTFLCGEVGALAVGAVVYHRLGESNTSKQYLDELLSKRSQVNDLESGLPDEFLYGRAGYLYALHFVRNHLGRDRIPDQYLEEICESMVSSGKTLSRQERSPCPLMYEWHGSKYLGAAHGLSGIYYLLMMSSQGHVKSIVREAVDYMLSLQWPSGNCPSSLGSERDKLVHWCHGAPGWIYMFIKAYEVYNDEKYLRAAERCAECIWSRGLLKKGYGLCHGTAGNGYAFLLMYRVTGREVYLHRALEFADWCTHYGQHGCRIADRPYSLFEGMAGTIYYLADILDPVKARFPGFEVD